MNTIKPLALGLAIGLGWALYVLLIGITSMFGWGNAIVTVLSSLYIGYDASVIGAIIGAIWGFVDGFVCGLIVAWVYNWAAK